MICERLQCFRASYMRLRHSATHSIGLFAGLGKTSAKATERNITNTDSRDLDQFSPSSIPTNILLFGRAPLPSLGIVKSRRGSREDDGRFTIGLTTVFRLLDCPTPGFLPFTPTHTRFCLSPQDTSSQIDRSLTLTIPTPALSNLPNSISRRHRNYDWPLRDAIE
jgi:hypothetical protein